MALNAVRRSAAVGLFLTAMQMALTAGVQPQMKVQTPPASLESESSSPLSALHGIEKKSVSILARNGDLPYFRKEWNKKLHPGFRGMNVEDKDEEPSPSKRYVGALARGGTFPMAQGKRASGGRYDMLDGISPEEALLEAYLPAEWGSEEYPEAAEDKRGGVGSLVRAGYMPYEGRYSSGKRSVAALARSGELLTIGRGSNQEREGGNGANKRGLGSILRHGGISTIGKVPVYSIGTPTSGKRGIESLARNYALPSMINQEYENKNDLVNGEDDEGVSGEMGEPLYEDISPEEEIEGPNEGDTQEELAKRHLGSFVRTYGLRPGVKRNLGSILRNGGSFHHSGKRNDGFAPYDLDYAFNEKRHFSSLLKNQAGYMPSKRDFDDDSELSEMEKRHLGSILHGKNAFINGKRYLGSIARQGLLGNQHEKRESLEGALDDGQWSRGDYNVGKRSISEGESGLLKGHTLDEHGNMKVTNGTAEDELKNAAAPSPYGEMSRKSTDQDEGIKKVDGDRSSNHRQRRSLSVPYSTSNEYPMPVLQNTDFYNLENEDEDEIAAAPGKRFMDNSAGSLDRWGWFPRQFPRTTPLDEGGGGLAAPVEWTAVQGWPEERPATFQLRKRHIGALARLGWLPAIRSQRRYSRGLGKRSEEEYKEGREDTTHGTQSAPNRISNPVPFAPEASLLLIGGRGVEWMRNGDFPLESDAGEEVQRSDDWRVGSGPADGPSPGPLPNALNEKRYLLLPAIDHLLLRKLYPRQMLPLLV